MKIICRGHLIHALLLSATLMLTDCVRGSGGGQKTGDDVADTLANLNIDTTETARVDKNIDPLSDSFTPIGKNRTLS